MFDRAERLGKGYDEEELKSAFDSRFAHRDNRLDRAYLEYWTRRMAWVEKATKKFLGIEKVREQKGNEGRV